jgi:hypothetical protein
MPESMRSPTTALIWEIWSRGRTLVWLVVAATLFFGLLNWVLPDSRIAGDDRNWLSALFTAAFISLLLVFSIFSYTEFNPRKESIGFPDRLFVLPVTSLLLVAVPITIGVAAAEVTYLAWAAMAAIHGGAPVSRLVVVLLGAYMVFYQTILWNLHGLRSLRMLVLGVLAIVMIALGFLPTFPPETMPPWFSERVLSVAVAGLALISFLGAWMGVARQRYGGGSGHYRNKGRIGQIADALPRRTRLFASAAAAQFWFEWRRSGLLLPLLTGALLLVLIGPLSWELRNDSGITLRILVAILALPLILAAPLGKAFSKPDFWSPDLGLPAFIAVRPLATSEMVAIKLRVAALSTALSWLLVLGFLSVWLPFWANLEGLAGVRFAVAQSHNLSIAVLSVLAGVFMTWRFLVAPLWIGLSGNRTLFAVSAAPYALVPLALIGFLLVFRPNSPLRVWIRQDPDRLLSILLWIAAVAVIAKFGLAVFSWRKNAAGRIRNYSVFWIGGTLCLIALAMLLPAHRFRPLLILVALLYIPLARVGLAVLSLARNRHG